LALPPPAAPSNLQADEISAIQIDLSWQDNSGDESEFRIERSPDGITDWEQIGTVASGVTSYSDIGLMWLTQYFYRVHAYRSGDGQVSDYSNIADATTNANLIFLPLIQDSSP
jgi:hypothetical protein